VIWLGSIFTVTLLLGMPIVFVLALSALSYFVLTGQTQFLITLPQRMFAGMDQFVLLAIPMFVLAGNLMEVGGLTNRLIVFANSIVGRFRGGLSLTAIWGSFLFGGVSGSAAAQAAALGSIMVPDMEKEGYDPDYSAALIATSSVMDPLVPPSITMIIYGSLSSTSISQLFIAGIVPAFLIAIGLTMYAVYIAHRRGYPKLAPVGFAEFARSAWASFPVLLLPFIIIFGIRGGVFTATEASGVAVVYALIIAAFYYRVLSWSHLRRALLATAMMSTVIYLLIAMANIAALIFAMEQLPRYTVELLTTITDNKYVLLLLVNLILLVLGMFLEGTGILILTVPALVAIGNTLGMDPVQLGVMVVTNVVIGFVHPPVGLCLYVVAGVTKRKVENVAWEALPMIGVALIVLALVALVPEISLFLPRLLLN
jgi:C4-dicarboxylate transporter, DctM subunit